MAIWNKETLHYKVKKTTTKGEDIEKFLDGLADKASLKFGASQRINSLLIYDNASVHKTKRVQKMFRKFKFKCF